MSIEITILGCGSSSGVPAIGNYWGSCDPSNPKNKRLRSSIFVKTNKTNIIILLKNDLTKHAYKICCGGSRLPSELLVLNN